MPNNENDILCIYHADCLDGFTSAWCVHRAFKEEGVNFLAATYGEEAPTTEELQRYREVYIVDFSYKAPVLRGMCEACPNTRFIVLDHHTTAMVDLGLLATAEDAPPNLNVEFDMERSGAQITWDFFHSISESTTTTRPKIVDYVGDRDLWKFKIPHTKEINAYLFSQSMDFAVWDEIAKDLDCVVGFSAILQTGVALVNQHNKLVLQALPHATRAVIMGYEVPIINAPPNLASDIGHSLSNKSSTFAAIWCMKWDSTINVSLRSDRKYGMDVSVIAKQFGGGGHKNAAGFSIGFEQLHQMIKEGLEFSA